MKMAKVTNSMMRRGGHLLSLDHKWKLTDTIAITTIRNIKNNNRHIIKECSWHNENKRTRNRSRQLRLSPGSNSSVYCLKLILCFLFRIGFAVRSEVFLFVYLLITPCVIIALWHYQMALDEMIKKKIEW